MKAKIITTSLLLSLLLILTGCAGVRYDPAGLGYFYGTPVYDGMGPGYYYPAYGYYGEYGGYLYGNYTSRSGFYYDTHRGFYPGHRGDSWRAYRSVPTGRRFKSPDFGNLRRHTGRPYMNREEGRKLYHSDRGRIESSWRGKNGSGNIGYKHRGSDRDHRRNHARD